MLSDVPSSERLRDLGTGRGLRLLREVASEIRDARLAAGMSQQAVADAVRMSRSAYGRVERAEVRDAGCVRLARICRVLGLDLSLRVYPAGPPIRDAAQIRLLKRFQ
ncbi:MAG: helix-turn-helix transcriptional regulator, partial [Chloroflexi bacterium]|nr:helix-turn-helix transcriptional regulator [Chloroflexota bacterium]